MEEASYYVCSLQPSFLLEMLEELPRMPPYLRSSRIDIRRIGAVKGRYESAFLEHTQS